MAEACPEGPAIPRGEIGHLQLSDDEERVLARFRLGLFERTREAVNGYPVFALVGSDGRCT